ncbi:ShlB/FhaC/HecB family hemolysin secretion/activation protein [Sphingomonas xanthus]|uniref:ShlB/FhaC/HecB family hemolysin secretion/activation protein n=1 Tax=Sphingomonas xanthus TaxID=2594473 RepID=A0A516IRV7_9SPHN|nr:ShlB/FhaC/HecB family hemolysin secretion/activation protein [Sphingomonas xanthus]QDP19652.1 ShlB/FhaC/HecB family hemolysin secretion/activation protein [Sphingomonas xanthus]
MGRWTWRNHNIGTFLLGSAALLAAVPATAQSVAPTREELSRITTPREGPRPSLNVVGDVERSPCPLADPRYADVRLAINDVQFNNLKGASPEEMRSTWAQFAGPNQPVAVLCEIRDAAATLLRNKGYLAAVQVPTQRIDDGVVRMETLYARVTAVRARGQTDGAEAKLAAYLNKLTEDEYFDRNRAERYLLLARDIPGYNVQLTLKPAGTGPGELVGEVAVLRRPFSLDATVQNLAASSTGRWGGQVRGQLYGLTGLGDVTTLSFYSTADLKEQKILQAAHSFRPGSEGLTIGGQLTYAWTKPDIGGNEATPDLKAKTLYWSVDARYPLIRSQSSNLWAGLGFDFLDQKVEFFGPLTRDKLRVLWLRADWDAIDLTSRRPAWKANAFAELRKGLDIFDASDAADAVPPSRIDGEADATVLRLGGQAELALGRDMAIAVSPRLQYAFDALLSFEEFTAGNYTVGRGYDPGTLSGDSGVGLTVEMRGPRLAPIARSRLTLQPYVFGDAAWAWNKNDGMGADRLTSAGAGVRAELSDRFRLDSTLAVPLEKAGIDNRKGDVRLLVTLTGRILP